MNTQLDELIARHLNGTLSEDDRQLLAMLLKVPENQLYLASRIDEEFLDENLKEEIDEETGTIIFQKIQERVSQNTDPSVGLENVPSESDVVHISWYRKTVFRWLAAASVILIISLVVLWSNNKEIEQPVAMQGNKRADSTASLVRHEINTTGKDKRIQLPDGTLVVLADKSEITYHEPFIGKRDILLTGKANFKVAKDKTRPFIVMSGNLSTTALGTEFTVTAFAYESQLTVRLFEGRVVVRSVEKKDWRMKNDVYLLPGQELVYNQQAQAYVRTFNRSHPASGKTSNKEISRDDPAIPENMDGSWYMFNNQSLEQVLDNLAALYNTKIIYNKKDIQDINWTGNYNKSVSLETILKRIGTVHNLTVTNKDSAFIISK